MIVIIFRATLAVRCSNCFEGMARVVRLLEFNVLCVRGIIYSGGGCCVAS